MTPDQITQVIAGSLADGGEQLLEGTLAAILPVLWLLMIALHIAQPYMLNVVQKFSLRLGADIWWLAYVLIRDAVLLMTFGLGIVLFYPNLVKGASLPLTGSLATALLLVGLAVKLTRDADDNAADFRLVTTLILVSSALYLIPQVFGVEAADQDYLKGISTFLTTSSNLDWAMPLLYLSYAILIATRVYLFTVVTFLKAKEPVSRRPRVAPAATTPHERAARWRVNTIRF